MNEDKRRPRTAEQRELDKEFLIQCQKDHPELAVYDYYLLLLAHIKERGDKYEISHVTVYNDYNAINDVSIDITESTRKDHKYKAIHDHDLIITALVQELTIRINEDRVQEEITYEDVVAKDLDKFAIDELMVFNKIRSKIKKKTVKQKPIRKGSDIKDICSAILEAWEKKRKMLGLDEPKKIENKHIHKNVDSMEDHELAQLLKDLQGDEQKVIEFISSIFNNKN